MKQILVTGGAGYIGSHVCKQLFREGFAPICVDNLSSGHAESVKWGPLILADVSDERLFTAIVKQINPSAIIHLAGRIETRSQSGQEGLFYRDNTLTTRSVLNAMKRCHIPHLLFASTGALYKSSLHPLCEKSPLNPLNAYARSKLAAEELIQKESKSYALLRLFNACGSDLEGEIGESHPIETHLIPLALFAALRLRPTLTLFGSSHPTPDGSAVRDYIHVTDIARALVASLKALLAGSPSFIANVGSGLPHSVHEIVSLIERLIGPIPLCQGPARSDEPSSLVSHASFLRQHVGFTPQYSDMRLIIESAHRWIRLCQM